VDYGASWGDNEFDLQCPSGAWCRVQKLDPLFLVEEGLLQKLDFVTSVVMGEHVKNAEMSTAQRVKKQREEKERALTLVKDSDLSSIMDDPSKISNLRVVLDAVAIRAVVRPTLHPAPKTEDQREAGLIYVDKLEFGDKMAIFSSVMKGVNALAQFREVPGEVVGDLASEPSVRTTTKPRARRAAPRKTR
jgi:hypothetical protein